MFTPGESKYTYKRAKKENLCWYFSLRMNNTFENRPKYTKFIFPAIVFSFFLIKILKKE